MGVVNSNAEIRNPKETRSSKSESQPVRNRISEFGGSDKDSLASPCIRRDCGDVINHWVKHSIARLVAANNFDPPRNFP